MSANTNNAAVVVRIVVEGVRTPINTPFEVLKGLRIEKEAPSKREGFAENPDACIQAFMEGRLGRAVPTPKEEVRQEPPAKKAESPKKGEGFASLAGGGGMFNPWEAVMTAKKGKEARKRAAEALKIATAWHESAVDRALEGLVRAEEEKEALRKARAEEEREEVRAEIRARTAKRIKNLLARMVIEGIFEDVRILIGEEEFDNSPCDQATLLKLERTRKEYLSSN